MRGSARYPIHRRRNDESRESNEESLTREKNRTDFEVHVHDFRGRLKTRKQSLGYSRTARKSRKRKTFALACLGLTSCIGGSVSTIDFLVFALNKRKEQFLCARMPEAFHLNGTRSHWARLILLATDREHGTRAGHSCILSLLLDLFLVSIVSRLRFVETRVPRKEGGAPRHSPAGRETKNRALSHRLVRDTCIGAMGHERRLTLMLASHCAAL